MRKAMMVSAMGAAAVLSSCSGRGEIIPTPSPASEPTTTPERINSAAPAPAPTTEAPTTTTEPEPEPTTTAYVAPATTVRVRPATTTSQYLQPEATTYSGACGGSLPPCYVMTRESRGSLTVYNYEGSGASGKWQIMPGTWNNYGGYANAADAPESVQDAKARELWAGGAGCQHWSAC